MVTFTSTWWKQNTNEKRMERIAALEKVKALGPDTVVAEHKRPGGLDVVYSLDASIVYGRDFQSLIDVGVYDAKVVYEGIMEKYGGRVNSQASVSGCIVTVKSVPKL